MMNALVHTMCIRGDDDEQSKRTRAHEVLRCVVHSVMVMVEAH
jgi:hypothetical protein